MTALEFLARWVDHVPERYQVRVRYAREESWPALRARRRRWAELLRAVFQAEVDVCPRCGGAMRILGFVTEPPVIRRILAHLERRGVDARAGPWVGAAAAPG